MKLLLERLVESQAVVAANPLNYNEFVRDLPILKWEYEVCCDRIIKECAAPDKDIDKITMLLKNALEAAKVFKEIYLKYLNVPREAHQFHQEIQEYQRLLDLPIEDEEGFSASFNGSKKIRDTTAVLNFPRLVAGRVKRVLDLVAALRSISQNFKRFAALMGKYAGPFFSYLSWIFFISRLTDNLLMTGAHLIPGNWKSIEEKNMPLSLRLQAQVETRWFELANDIVWCSAGILSCFVLLGVLALVGSYITIALFAYDALVAGLRAYIELGRLKDLHKTYHQNPDMKDFEQGLEKKIRYEQLRLGLSVINTSALFLGMCLTMPLLAFNPLFPLIGMSLVLSITIVSYLAGKYIERYKPENRISGKILSDNGFFKPKPSRENNLPDEDLVLGVNP